MPIKKQDPRRRMRRGGRGHGQHNSGKQPVAVAKAGKKNRQEDVAVAVAAPTSSKAVAVVTGDRKPRGQGAPVAQVHTHHAADDRRTQPVAVRRRRGPRRAPPTRTPHVDREVLRAQDTGPLRSGLREGNNADALTHARAAAEERRRQRMREFTTRVTTLRGMLAQMKKRAAHERIHAMRDTFDQGLEEALARDPQNRSRGKLLRQVGTSSDELDRLEQAYYHGRTIEPTGFTFSPPQGRRTRTIETIDAFAGGSRPVCTTPGRDTIRLRRPAFYDGIIVSRSVSQIPLPNPPIPMADTQRSRVIYPEGEPYGPHYEVENQLSRDLHARCMNMFVLFGLWFVKNKQMIEEYRQEGHTVTLDMLIEVFFKVFRKDPQSTMESLKDLADTGQVIQMGQRLLQQSHEEPSV